MSIDFLEKIYEGKTREDVVKDKSSQKQVRAVSGGSNGAVTLTPDECRKLCKQANDFQYFVGAENRVRQYKISDETVDRYGDIVRAKGVKLNNYKNNPVIQFAHDYSQPNIGISLKTWYDKETNAVYSWALFFDSSLDLSGRSDLIFRLISANAMRACSIGFTPIKYNDPMDKNEREKLGLGKWGVEFTEWDMMEFSPVPVPANPNALQDSYSAKSMIDFTNAIRSSGQFTEKDADILRATPIFGEDVIDTFIRELKAKKAIIKADYPGDAPLDPETEMPLTPDGEPIENEEPETEKPAMVMPTVNVNLDISIVTNAINGLTKQIDDVSKSVQEYKEEISCIRKELDTVLTTATRAVELAGGKTGIKRLYDALDIRA